MLLMFFILLTVVVSIAILISMLVFYCDDYKDSRFFNDPCYMTWREYKKFSRLFPNKFYIGKGNSYCFQSFESLFYLKQIYNRIEYIPIKFKFFTGFIPWCFVLQFRKIAKKTEQDRNKHKAENKAKAEVLADMQKLVEAELREAQKEINKAREINDSICQKLEAN